MKKGKPLLTEAFSPEAFRFMYLLVSLLGVCPLVAPVIEPYMKLLHVYALAVLIVDLAGERRVLRNKGRVLLVIFALSYGCTMLTNRNLFGFSFLSNFLYYSEGLALVYSFGKRSEARSRLTERFFAVAISCANLVGIGMFFGKYYHYVRKRGCIGMYQAENRLAGLFGNPNVLGMVCLGGIVLCCIRAVDEKKKGWKIFFWVLSFVNFVTLLLANSRTQIYSVVLMAAVTAFTWMLKAKPNGKRFWRAALAGILCAAVVFTGGRLLQRGMSRLDVNYEYYLLNISTQRNDLLDQYEELIQEEENRTDGNEKPILNPGTIDTIEREETQGFNGRADLWKMGWKLFLARPVFGTGMDNHDHALAQLGMDALPVRGNFHNAYLEVLVDFGLVGFACLAAFLLVMLEDVLRFFKYSDGTDWALHAVLLGGVAAFLMDGLADSTLVSSLYPTAVFFWMTASRYAALLEKENTRAGHFRPGLLCRWTDALAAKRRG